jgi:hypothetical protein
MHDPWTDKLSEYLEGTLSHADDAAMAAHLQHCSECRLVLAQLDDVRTIAREQPATPPATDLWPGIAARIAAGAPAEVIRLADRRPGASVLLRLSAAAQRRRAPTNEHRPPRAHFAFSLPQLAAAAVVLMALSGAGVWLAMGGAGPETSSAVAVRPAADNPARLASIETSGYESAIAELQRSLAQTATPLDSSTVAVLRHSLATIDAAIADARAALAQDPANPFLHRHLDGAMKKKVDILQRAVSARRAAS